MQYRAPRLLLLRFVRCLVLLLKFLPCVTFEVLIFVCYVAVCRLCVAAYLPPRAWCIPHRRLWRLSTFVYGMSGAEEMAIGDWTKFLLASDEQARKRGDEWVRPIAERVVALDMLEPGDLQGGNLDKLKLDPLSEVKVAVLRRAQSTVERTSAPPTRAQSDVSELAKLLGKEKKREKVTEIYVILVSVN